jgi:hypothetical protein
MSTSGGGAGAEGAAPARALAGGAEGATQAALDDSRVQVLHRHLRAGEPLELAV